MRTRIKICGITRPADAAAAARLGADAIGLVFCETSPRRVTPGRAVEIVAALPPFVTVVGLFVDAPADAVRAVLETVRIDLLQFHGAETPQTCLAFGRPYIKAIRVGAGTDVRREAAAYHEASGLLLDTHRPGVPGGTGECFDWNVVPAELGPPVILAGGLTPENVMEAISAVHPYAVDVSSGVESSRGIKDAGRMAAFFAAVRAGDDMHRESEGAR